MERQHGNPVGTGKGDVGRPGGKTRTGEDQRAEVDAGGERAAAAKVDDPDRDSPDRVAKARNRVEHSRYDIRAVWCDRRAWTGCS